MSGRRQPDPFAWWQLGLDGWRMSAEAGAVIWLRSLKVMEGGAPAQRELSRMVSEKMEAQAEIATAMMTGTAGTSAEAIAKSSLASYGKRVNANRRRLGRRS